MISQDLAQQIFDEINQCTLPGDGITRPSYSQEETAAHAVVGRYAKEFGFETQVDGVGNLHCVYKTSETRSSVPEFVTGSHLDSVRHGGRYDGVAGVVAGLLAMHQVRQSRSPSSDPTTLRLIVFRGEESAWFGKCYLGSLGLFGLLTKQDLDRRSVADGETLGRRIAHRGGWEEYAGGHPPIGRKIMDPSQIARFVEVHIEQGPVLHEAGEPIGIVDSIRGNYRYSGARIVGESGHSGTMPTHLRKDAVLAFADLMYHIEMGMKAFGEDLVMTCGVAGTDPARHAATVIPDLVTFDLEFRSGSQASLELFDKFYRGCYTAALAKRRLPDGFIGMRTVTAPADMDPTLNKELRHHARHLLDTENVMRLPSGAGHDAAVFSKMGVPTGMIFIRNEHGSHNPRESMRMDDFMLATELLCRAMGGKP